MCDIIPETWRKYCRKINMGVLSIFFPRTSMGEFIPEAMFILNCTVTVLNIVFR